MQGLLQIYYPPFSCHAFYIMNFKTFQEPYLSYPLNVLSILILLSVGLRLSNYYWNPHISDSVDPFRTFHPQRTTELAVSLGTGMNSGVDIGGLLYLVAYMV